MGPVTTERVNTTTGEVLPASPREQLAKLAQPFPRKLVESKDGNSYVAHSTVTEWLLGIVGPFNFDLVETIRGDMPAVAPNPQGSSRRAKAGVPALTNIVVGGVWRLTVEVDGRVVHVEEVGDVGDPHNWPHDGARLKDAASDSLKRCAMRLGLGLHLWSGASYTLGERLRPELTRQDDGRPAEASPSHAPEAGATSPAPASGSNGQADA